MQSSVQRLIAEPPRHEGRLSPSKTPFYVASYGFLWTTSSGVHSAGSKASSDGEVTQVSTRNVRIGLDDSVEHYPLMSTAAVRVPANQYANVVRAQADSQNPDTWPNTSDVAAELKSLREALLQTQKQVAAQRSPTH